MNTYRVDRNCSATIVPCGMNSLMYIGDSNRTAMEVFQDTQPGYTPWNQADPKYGVTLSKWDGKNYVVIAKKGI